MQPDVIESTAANLLIPSIDETVKIDLEFILYMNPSAVHMVSASRIALLLGILPLNLVRFHLYSFLFSQTGSLSLNRN